MNIHSHRPCSQFKCEIRLKNHMDNYWFVLFEWLSINNTDDNEVVISGLIPDQSALFGLLNKIRDLNLKVISLNIQARKKV